MRITASIPASILAVLGGCAVSMAAPVLADDSLNGHYQAVVDGSRTNPLGGILIVNTQCDPTGNCTGWVSTPKTWGAAINKSPGGSWTINRTDPTAWTCGDGSKAAADLVYSFAPPAWPGRSLRQKQRVDAAIRLLRPLRTHSRFNSASMFPAEGCAREVLPRGFVGHLVLRLLGTRRVRVAALMLQLLFLDTLILRSLSWRPSAPKQNRCRFAGPRAASLSVYK